MVSTKTIVSFYVKKKLFISCPLYATLLSKFILQMQIQMFAVSVKATTTILAPGLTEVLKLKLSLKGITAMGSAPPTPPSAKKAVEAFHQVLFNSLNGRWQEQLQGVMTLEKIIDPKAETTVSSYLIHTIQ